MSHTYVSRKTENGDTVYMLEMDVLPYEANQRCDEQWPLAAGVLTTDQKITLGTWLLHIDATADSPFPEKVVIPCGVSLENAADIMNSAFFALRVCGYKAHPVKFADPTPLH